MLKNIHALLSIMPRVKLSSYNHRKKTCFKSKVNTMRFKNSFNFVLSFKMYIRANSYIRDSLYAFEHTNTRYKNFNCFINLHHPHLLPSSHQINRKLDENAFRASQGILINCRTGLCLFCQLLLSEIALRGQPGTKHKPQAE